MRSTAAACARNHLHDARGFCSRFPGPPSRILVSFHRSVSGRSVIRPIELRACFREPVLDVMNFLNSATVDYPDAISFAPGRPYEGLFDVAGGLASIDQYVAHRVDTATIAEERVRADLGQYQPTSGSI